MSESVVPVQDQVEQEKQRNFDNLRKQAENERAARIALEERLAAIEKSSQSKPVDDDDDDEPYVDKKKLNKKLTQFGQQFGQQTSDIVKHEVEKALREERKQNWYKQNSDFNKVMSADTLSKFEALEPDLAASILSVPDEFERQKLAYLTIKAKGLDRPEVKQPTAQELIDKNRKTPFYQPTGIPSAPYNGSFAGKDYSDGDKKTAYDQMKALQSRLRI